jgi:hypothetical protein
MFQSSMTKAADLLSQFLKRKGLDRRDNRHHDD